MKITKDSVASFHYTLTDNTGTELETSRDAQPIVYLHGRKGILPALEAQLADIDTNHPLAGKTLQFDIEIVDVRAATADELGHGHAHGPGGHEH